MASGNSLSVALTVGTTLTVGSNLSVGGSATVGGNLNADVVNVPFLHVQVGGSFTPLGNGDVWITGTTLKITLDSDERDVAVFTVDDTLALPVLMDDPASPADGEIWRTAAGLRGKVGTALGTFDFTADV